MAKWIAAEEARTGLRHAVVVCPNVTGRTKEIIAQSKRARAGSLAIVDYPQVVRICILRALVFFQMLFGGTLIIGLIFGASGVCTRCMRRYGSVW